MEPSSSKKSRLDERKRPKINNEFGTRAVPSTSTTMAATLLKWAYSKSELAAESDPEEGGKRFVKWSRSISKMTDLNEPRRKVLTWAHSTSTIRAPDERKRWSLQGQISKHFETTLKRLQEENGYTDLKQEHMMYTCQKGMHGVHECQNALWIWPRIRNSCTVTIKPIDGGPREVGKKIKEKFSESDMIEGRPFINDLGFVTIELSWKWIAKSIHKMLKDYIDTWAPKLPVEREDRAQKVLNRWFSTEERQDMTQRDFDNAYKDLLALWYGLQRADWMVYMLENPQMAECKFNINDEIHKEECMRTRRSYFPIKANVTIPRRQRKQISNIVEPELRTIVAMADNRTMAQMLQAPIEGYEDAIVVPPINVNNFELKQTLINIVQKLHQLDTFYNVLNPNDQDALDSVARGIF
nr:arginine--tRNA ligase, chloroplastic/mitochondrial [Tanacetum cinerariifolium]